jgi:hypothetical protein
MILFPHELSTHLWFPRSDPDEDPVALFFFSAQSGSIAGMEKAMSKSPEVLFRTDVFERRSALHLAAGSYKVDAVDAVRWLLKKGVPWSAADGEGHIPEELARISKNEESRIVLRNWAIEFGEVTRIDVPS